MDKELKSCPFCRKKGLIILKEWINDTSIHFYRIQHGPEIPCGVSLSGTDRNKVIELWNTQQSYSGQAIADAKEFIKHNKIFECYQIGDYNIDVLAQWMQAFKEQAIAERMPSDIKKWFDKHYNIIVRGLRRAAKHETDKGIRNVYINTLEEMPNKSLQPSQPKEEQQEYHLNCDRCGATFWTKEAFPEPQLCYGCTVMTEQPKNCIHFDQAQGRNKCCNEDIKSNTCIGTDCGGFKQE